MNENYIIQYVLRTYNNSFFNILRHALFLSLLLRVFGSPILLTWRLGSTWVLKSFYQRITRLVFKYSRKLIPSLDRAVKQKIEESVLSIQSSLVPAELPKTYSALPYKGIPENELRNELNRYSSMNDLVWKDGKVSGTVYHNDEELLSLSTEAFGIFSLSNPLHPELFQGVRQMEAEVVSMVLAMYNAPPSACGNMTSGGTESLLLAVKTYRDRAYDLFGITEPEMIVPNTIHAAFEKAAAYFKVKLISIPVDLETGKVSPRKVKRAISRNTVLIAASAPNFPHGIIDDIRTLAELANSYRIGFHVDACLGGFLLPFMNAAGYTMEYDIDFKLKGVTSISVDTHKYGFAPKGSSVIMYKNHEIRKYQYFVSTDWPGGIYASPSMAGSRPGALIAACWTSLMHMGVEGYVESTKQIVSATRFLADEIESIPELTVIGEPQLSVLAFSSVSKAVPIFGIAQILSKCGYHLNILQNPPAIHMAMTLPATNAVQELVKDIKRAVEEIKEDPEKGKGEVSAIYGTVASVPDRSILEDVAFGFCDALTML